jgi:double-stranded uracil-DNA glycosylase
MSTAYRDAGRFTARRLRDRIGADVRVLFVGINPGIRSAETGHHFAGYSNRFWKLLSDSHLVPEPITFEDDDRLPDWGFGITNIVPRATPGMNALRSEEYVAGARALFGKIRRHRPPIVAIIGVTVWRALLAAVGEPRAKTRAVALGFQDTAALGEGFRRAVPSGTRFFVLPNPSGRNANYSYGEMLAAFELLRRAVAPPRGGD